MKSLGIYMAIFGLGSIVLNFFDMQFKILSWIDNWGPTVGWSIRLGLIVVGAALWFFTPNKEEAAA